MLIIAHFSDIVHGSDTQNFGFVGIPTDFPPAFVKIDANRRECHDLEGCQGKPRTPEILEKVCPQCGSEIELFTCDTQAVCEHCGFVVYNDTLSCVQWCKYARQCVGDAMYEQMMAIAERQKANRKLRKSEDNTHDQTDH